MNLGRYDASWLAIVGACVAPRGAEPDAPKLVVTENGREVAVRWLALTARDSRNSEFALCFEREDGLRRDLDCYVDLGEFEANSLGDHLLDDDRLHECVWFDASALPFVTAATKLEPSRYVDRPVELESRCWPEKASFQVGERVRLNWAITNRASRTVRWRERFSSNGFVGSSSCELWRDGKLIASRVLLGDGRSGSFRPQEGDLATGETLEDGASVLPSILLAEAGDYEVRATFVITVLEPEPTYSNAHACPVIRADCDEFFDATLRFTLTR